MRLRYLPTTETISSCGLKYVSAPYSGIASCVVYLLCRGLREMQHRTFCCYRNDHRTHRTTQNFICYLTSAPGEFRVVLSVLWGHRCAMTGVLCGMSFMQMLEKCNTELSVAVATITELIELHRTLFVTCTYLLPESSVLFFLFRGVIAVR